MTKNNVPGPFTRENAFNEIVDKVKNKGWWKTLKNTLDDTIEKAIINFIKIENRIIYRLMCG